jgi:hypothetical protein
LNGALERALSIGDGARYPELVGAVEALAACGAVSEQVARDARRRLDEAFSRVPSPALADVRPPGGRAPVPAERLRAVLCPAVALAEVDGVSVMLVAVELWTSTVIVRVAGTGGPEPEPAAGRSGATSVWWRVAGDARAAASGPPGPRGLGLPGVPLRLTDDVGTSYAITGGQAAGEPPWRAEHRFVPGVPASASRLAVAVERSDGSDGARLELELSAER